MRCALPKQPHDPNHPPSLCPPHSNNSYCKPQHLAWPWRQPLVLSELARYDADLICLQEVEDGFYQQQLQPWMAQRGFNGLYRPRNMGGPGASGPLDGVSLLWRTAMFTEVATQQLRFADKAAVVLPVTPAGASTSFARLVDGKDEGAVMALLQHKPSGEHVLACRWVTKPEDGQPSGQELSCKPQLRCCW